jgi:hypothetical protein
LISVLKFMSNQPRDAVKRNNHIEQISIEVKQGTYRNGKRPPRRAALDGKV